jgi:hypothetical protein
VRLRRGWTRRNEQDRARNSDRQRTRLVHGASLCKMLRQATYDDINNEQLAGRDARIVNVRSWKDQPERVRLIL